MLHRFYSTLLEWKWRRLLVSFLVRGDHMLSEKSQWTENGTMFVDLDWLLNASSPLSASAELLVILNWAIFLQIIPGTQTSPKKKQSFKIAGTIFLYGPDALVSQPTVSVWNDKSDKRNNTRSSDYAEKPARRLYRSLKVTDNIRYVRCGFLLVCHCNFVSKMHLFEIFDL